MQYRDFGRTGLKVSALGFGCMRLPSNENGEVNVDEAVRQIRYAIENGVNYLDTAYIYHGGNSERVLGKAIKDGYREKVFVADKLPIWSVKKYEDCERLLNEQLERLDVEYIDFYLVHALNGKAWAEMKAIGVTDFLDKALKDGKIKYAGFSFHDGTQAFKDIIDSYDWSFCQMQYNYIDEFNQAGVEGLKYAASKGLGVVIMEPLLGGKLAITPPAEIQELWDSADNKRKPAEWGLKWIWNQKEVSVVLSGMNAQSQVEENLKTAGEAVPGCLSIEEVELISKVRTKYKELNRVPCTGCKYCMPCPAGVNIPENFSSYNQASMYNDWKGSKWWYENKNEKERASSCVECGKCEKVCPQHISIRQHLKDFHKEMTLVR